jgi:hypothetical protein
VTRASFGTPRRTVLGADYNRVCVLLAVLEKRAGLPIGGRTSFVNVAGGGRVNEPAADLGIVIAAASSYLERPGAARRPPARRGRAHRRGARGQRHRAAAARGGTARLQIRHRAEEQRRGRVPLAVRAWPR